MYPSMIVATSSDNIIGVNGKLPWHCRSDLKMFKELTMNNIVIMGKNTYLSLFDHMKDKATEPLPGRIKYVITNHSNEGRLGHHSYLESTYALTIKSQEHATALLQDLNLTYPGKEKFVIGGAQIYKLFEPFYERIILTRILDEGNVLRSLHDGEKVDYFSLSRPIEEDYILTQSVNHEATSAFDEYDMQYEIWNRK